MFKVYVVENKETHQRAMKPTPDGLYMEEALFVERIDAEKFKLQCDKNIGIHIVKPILMSRRRIYELYGNRIKID